MGVGFVEQWNLPKYVDQSVGKPLHMARLTCQ